jgi:hypothetical protein
MPTLLLFCLALCELTAVPVQAVAPVGQTSDPQPPTLSLAMTLTVQVGPPTELGEVPRGRRRIIPILGGTFEGPTVRGKVMAGGADWQLVRADGLAELDTRYMLQTDGGSLVYIQNAGIRHAPPDVAKKLLAGQPVDPSQVYFKTVPTFETSAPELQWLTRSIFVGTGERRPTEVVIRVWRVE